MFRSFATVSVCLALIGLPAVPQSWTKQDPPPKPAMASKPDPGTLNITVSTTEVIVPVTVTDEKGRFVSNLEAKDFRLTDEGKPQRISFFSHQEKQPIVVG